MLDKYRTTWQVLHLVELLVLKIQTLHKLLATKRLVLLLLMIHAWVCCKGWKTKVPLEFV